MNKVIITRKIGEPFRLANDGEEATVTLQSFDNGVARFLVEVNSRMKIDSDEYEYLDDFEKAVINSYFKQNNQ